MVRLTLEKLGTSARSRSRRCVRSTFRKLAPVVRGAEMAAFASIEMQTALLGLAGASVWRLFGYRRRARFAESSALSIKEVTR